MVGQNGKNEMRHVIKGFSAATILLCGIWATGAPVGGAEQKPPALQQPPAAMPADAPKLGAMAPGDVAAWRQRWAEFLFGDDLPNERPPLNVREDRREESGGIERAHIIYDVEPGVATEAYVLRRKDAGDRRPGVVVFHSTSAETIEQSGSLDTEVDRHIGAHLAQRGYVVIAPKCYLWGAAGQPPPPKVGPAFWAGEIAKMQERHPRWKGLARMVWDGIRAVDVLSERSDVDAGRIGCIGHSLGAKESLFLPAFDRRVKAAVSSDGGIGLTLSNWDAPWYLGLGIRAPGFDLENHQVLAMIAPRAFLLVAGKDDNERSWPFIACGLPLWESLGTPDAIGWFRHAAGHNWPPEAQEVGYAFLDRHLKPLLVSPDNGT